MTSTIGQDCYRCDRCRKEFNLTWVEKGRGTEYEGDEACPYCGWPAPTPANQKLWYISCKPGIISAPCPICSKLTHPIGTMAQRQEVMELACGHWVIGDVWGEYGVAFARGDGQAVLDIAGRFKKGLVEVRGLETFVKKTPIAGETAQ